MAASTAGALKQIIESFGLGLAAYRDVAPADAVEPFCVVQEEITIQTIKGGDAGAGDTLIENCQVDLYQSYFNRQTGKVVENSILTNALRKKLNGPVPPTDIPWRIHGIRVPFSTRGRLADDNSVRTRMSVDVHRDQ